MVDGRIARSSNDELDIQNVHMRIMGKETGHEFDKSNYRSSSSSRAAHHHSRARVLSAEFLTVANITNELRQTGVHDTRAAP